MAEASSHHAIAWGQYEILGGKRQPHGPATGPGNLEATLSPLPHGPRLRRMSDWTGLAGSTESGKPICAGRARSGGRTESRSQHSGRPRSKSVKIRKVACKNQSWPLWNRPLQAGPGKSQNPRPGAFGEFPPKHWRLSQSRRPESNLRAFCFPLDPWRRQPTHHCAMHQATEHLLPPPGSTA